MAEEIVRQHMTVTGVQPKLSLSLAPGSANDGLAKLTIVGVLGRECILKLPPSRYSHLPEMEDVTMHLAKLARIATMPHGLLRLQDGALAYVTRRIDWRQKLHMEEMCQLNGRLMENKYDGPHEQIAKALRTPPAWTW